MSLNTDRTDMVAMVGDGPHSRILVHALIQRFGRFPIVMEAGEDQVTFWKRRLKKLGLLETLSLRLAALPMRFAKLLSHRRLVEILSRADVNTGELPEPCVVRVPSVNADATAELLLKLQPKVIFVCSTRVIKPRLLLRVDATFINYHSGINPAYRGIHGGYHARAEGQEHLFGTTLHIIDEGIDTGTVLATHIVKTTRHDSVHTYIQLMAADSITTVCDTIARALAGDLTPEPQRNLPSKLWHGPGLFSYIGTGLRRGVW